MGLPRTAPIHVMDYLEAEEASPGRAEYVAGHVHAMTGGTLRHNRIALNTAFALTRRLGGGPCKVFVNDVKLHVQAADSVYYPDVLVFCGLAGPKATLLADATLVVEVTSDSTASIDRREKLAAYQKLPGLRAYWVLDHEAVRAEVHRRGADGFWTTTELEAEGLLAAADYGAAADSEPLRLGVLYDDTGLP
jgi:Uma2 family endonuclease